jgi:hypothetical protein
MLNRRRPWVLRSRYRMTTGGDRRDADKKAALPAGLVGEQAERGAGVVHMHQIEEAGDGNDVDIGGHPVDHRQLGDLVEHQHQQR